MRGCYMIPLLAVLGVYLWLEMDRASVKPKPKPKPEPRPDPPRPADDQFEDMDEETIEKVYSGDGFAVFKIGFLMGLIYDDGTDQRRYEYSFVIGNEEGTSFVSANSDRGTRTIQGQKRVMVFPSRQAAIEDAERPRGNDPNDPTSPQPQPQPEEDEPEPPRPPMPPLAPGFGGMPSLSPNFGGI